MALIYSVHPWWNLELTTAVWHHLSQETLFLISHVPMISWFLRETVFCSACLWNMLHLKQGWQSNSSGLLWLGPSVWYRNEWKPQSTTSRPLVCLKTLAGLTTTSEECFHMLDGFKDVLLQEAAGRSPSHQLWCSIYRIQWSFHEHNIQSGKFSCQNLILTYSTFLSRVIWIWAS